MSSFERDEKVVADHVRAIVTEAATQLMMCVRVLYGKPTYENAEHTLGVLYSVKKRLEVGAEECVALMDLAPNHDDDTPF